MKKYRVVIAYHETLPCYIGEHIKEYLLEKYSTELLLIGHPLLENKESYKGSSRFEYFKNSKLIIKKNAFHWVMPRPLLHLKDMVYTFLWCLKYEGIWDAFFGINNINVLVALLLKKMGKIRKVIYHPVDYEPTRFDNKFLNWLYFQFDKICVQYADETWNVSEYMIDAREKRMGLKRDAKQYVFPICVWVNKTKRLPFNKINTKKIVYRGSLFDWMGVDLIINAMPQIVKKIPGAVLEIFGDGQYRAHLESEVQRLKVGGCVKFYGWVKDRKILEECMSDGALGIATFNTKITDDRVKNGDPGKIKDYMLMGMPVITTCAVSYSKQIIKTRSGLVVNYKKEDLTKAVIKLLSDRKLLKEYRENALNFVSQFDCGKLFDKNISRVLNYV
ncbi:glycosyltransferase [Candidatus Daviesbacteria bacterium]|nr:glycosyltransferase [Candidatus Daviesbacteria bacterium]